jgi:hypothetical protein
MTIKRVSMTSHPWNEGQGLTPSKSTLSGRRHGVCFVENDEFESTRVAKDVLCTSKAFNLLSNHVYASIV